MIRLFARFCTVGAAAAVIGMVVLYLAVDVCGMHYLAGGGVSWAASTGIGYAWNTRHVFRAAFSMDSLWKFVSSRGVALGIGIVIYAAFVEAGIWYMAASMLSTVAVTFGNFVVARWWVWKQH